MEGDFTFYTKPNPQLALILETRGCMTKSFCEAMEMHVWSMQIMSLATNCV